MKAKELLDRFDLVESYLHESKQWKALALLAELKSYLFTELQRPDCLYPKQK